MTKLSNNQTKQKAMKGMATYNPILPIKANIYSPIKAATASTTNIKSPSRWTIAKPRTMKIDDQSESSFMSKLKIKDPIPVFSPSNKQQTKSISNISNIYTRSDYKVPSEFQASPKSAATTTKSVVRTHRYSVSMMKTEPSLMSPLTSPTKEHTRSMRAIIGAGKPKFARGQKPYVCSAQVKMILLSKSIKNDSDLVKAAKEQGIKLTVTMMSESEFTD
jgi:hypothetical protein